MSISTRIEEALVQTLNHYCAAPTPPHLAESIRYSCLAPGKRIRPRLLLATAEMLGLSEESVMPSAIALELTHCFTLIHDDLPCMDNDDWRRGQPSNHKKFGEQLALLAGDALMALAGQILLDAKVPTDRLILGSQRLAWATGPVGVIGGQAAESLVRQDPSLAQLQQMHRQKTGALFAAALLIPKDFAGIQDTEEKGQALIQFADALGLAFQIADDLEEAVTSTPPPVSILYYLSRKEAVQYALQPLNLACEKIITFWGTSARPLQKLVEEISHKTRTAMEIHSA